MSGIFLLLWLVWLFGIQIYLLKLSAFCTELLCLSFAKQEMVYYKKRLFFLINHTNRKNNKLSIFNPAGPPQWADARPHHDLVYPVIPSTQQSIAEFISQESSILTLPTCTFFYWAALSLFGVLALSVFSYDTTAICSLWALKLAAQCCSRPDTCCCCFFSN